LVFIKRTRTFNFIQSNSGRGVFLDGNRIRFIRNWMLFIFFKKDLEYLVGQTRQIEFENDESTDLSELEGMATAF